MGKQREQRRRRQPPAESRGAEVVTVVWMTSVVTTVVCGAVAALVLLVFRGDQPQIFGRLLHFSAFVSAALSLVLLGVVLKVRSVAPPPVISWFAVVVALSVIAAAALLY